MLSLSRPATLTLSQVVLALSICEPIDVKAAVASIDACADADELIDEMVSMYNETDPLHPSPIGLIATSRTDEEGEDECILASLGAWHTMDKQLLDPLFPTQGVQLEFGVWPMRPRTLMVDHL